MRYGRKDNFLRLVLCLFAATNFGGCGNTADRETSPTSPRTDIGKIIGPVESRTTSTGICFFPREVELPIRKTPASSAVFVVRANLNRDGSVTCPACDAHVVPALAGGDPKCACGAHLLVRNAVISEVSPNPLNK